MPLIFLLVVIILYILLKNILRLCFELLYDLLRLTEREREFRLIITTKSSDPPIFCDIKDVLTKVTIETPAIS